MRDATFQCDGCGKHYKWTPERAGRSVKCPCGHAMRVPAECPAPTDDLYDIAPETARLASAVPTVAPPQETVLAYQRPGAATVAAPVDAYFPDKVKDFQMPLVLLAGGVIIECIAGWWTSSRTGGGALHALSRIGIEVVLGTGLMLVALFAAARFRGIDLGRFWTAVLKLAAISVAPSALMTLLMVSLRFVPVFGGLLAWVAGFCFYFALIGAFFDLDQSDTWYCVMVIFLVKLAVFFALIGLLAM
ncbi:MAG: hypothetical protein ACHRHE_18275 [Tepidisphaerales bacterium]